MTKIVARKATGPVLVDDDVASNIPLNAWYCIRAGYVQRSFWKNNKTKTVLLHRLVMNAPRGMEVDHIDGNKLNNCRSNLRLCSHSQNQRNRTRLNKNNVSGAAGVYFDKRRRLWYCQVTLNGRAKTVASGFADIRDASRARQYYAKLMHGEFCPRVTPLSRELQSA